MSLAPSNFDALATIRSRAGIEINKQEMALFRESMLISERDVIEINRAQASDDRYLVDALRNIYNDALTLKLGADVVAERMRMQLLFPQTGGPAIYFSSKGTTYAYNYDGNGAWATNNRTDLDGTRQWANPSTAKPLDDIQTIVDNANEPIRYIAMSQATMNLFLACEQVKSAMLAQNLTANLFPTVDKAKELIKGLFADIEEVIVYKKKFKDESGAVQAFVPDGFVAFLPAGELGRTWYGMTAEEIQLVGNPKADIEVVDGVAVVVSQEVDRPPYDYTTTVSELVLPSFPKMMSCYLLGTGTADDEGGELDALTISLAKGVTDGTTVATITETVPSGSTLRYKLYASTRGVLPNYEQNVKLWTPLTSGTTEIAVTAGQELVVALADSNYLAKGAGVKAVASGDIK